VSGNCKIKDHDKFLKIANLCTVSKKKFQTQFFTEFGFVAINFSIIITSLCRSNMESVHICPSLGFRCSSDGQTK
jgi:hypothetical protein